MGLNPINFMKTNNIPYIETHHVNEVSNLEKGSLGISNLITLCANHHRQMHYGNVLLRESENTHFLFNIDGKEIKIIKNRLM